MKVDRIKIHDFRNIAAIDLKLCGNANIIYGNNGQGKTNFIEGIWLFTGAKSFRGAKDQQLVRFDAPQAALEIDFFGEGRDQSAMMVIEKNRVAVLNEIPLKTATELAGKFCAVVFSPVHLSLVKNGPQEKRKFLDTSICQLKPRYISVINQFTRALDQRNRLLKDIAYETSLFDTLDIWDARLAAFAAVIIKTRASFLEKLFPFAKEIYGGISGEKEKLRFKYISTLECDPQNEISEIEKRLLAGLRTGRGEDVRSKITNLGPHRDDIEITLDEKSSRIYASQGQQRSCVLALKLAECELIRETLGEYPVVLLDDVMSELDHARRDFLLNRLSGRQLIITCCDKGSFSGMADGISVRIENGEVVSRNEH